MCARISRSRRVSSGKASAAGAPEANEAAELLDHAIEGRLAGHRDVAARLERHQARARDRRREEEPLVERRAHVAARVQHERRAAHPREVGRGVDVAEASHDARRLERRARQALQIVERRDLLGRRAREHEVGEELPVGRVVLAPADLDHLELGLEAGELLGRGIAAQRAAREGARAARCGSPARGGARRRRPTARPPARSRTARSARASPRRRPPRDRRPACRATSRSPRDRRARSRARRTGRGDSARPARRTRGARPASSSLRRCGSASARPGRPGSRGRGRRTRGACRPPTA